VRGIPENLEASVPRFLLSVVLSSLSVMSCGGGGETKSAVPTGAPTRPSGKGACALLLQAEVDWVFGTPVGAGSSETLDGGVELCTWPAGEDPALLVQVGPEAPSATAAVDLGEGYRIVEIEGMSGPAALAIETKGKGTVAVLALNASNKTFTLSPIGLGVEDGSERLQKLKEILELVVKRSSSAS
jgi:hypothetical protein